MTDTYPKRVIKEELENICKCGHGSWIHDFNILDTTISLFTFGLVEYHKKCKECMCPKFKFGERMTMWDYVKKENMLR